MGIPWELLLENLTSSAWIFRGLNPHRTYKNTGGVLQVLWLLMSDLHDLVMLLVSQLCLILESCISDNRTYSFLPLFHKSCFSTVYSALRELSNLCNFPA